MKEIDEKASAFLYYLPGLAAVTLEQIKEHGIHGIFETDVSWDSATVLQNGPDKGRGMIVALHLPGARPTQMRADKQTWQKVGKYWIGYYTDQPPRAIDLGRAKGLAGHYVQCRKNKYQVPLLRYFEPEWGNPLPQVYAIDIDGNPVEQVDSRYVDLCREADSRFYWWCVENELVDLVKDIDSPDRPTNLERFDFAARVIAVNYRVSNIELRILQEIGTDELKRIEEAVFDWPTVMAFSADSAKKNPSPPQVDQVQKI